MSDIVERLRRGEPCREGCGAPCKVMDAASGCACAEAADHIEKLEAALRGIKWRSADKDNMEFAATITYSQMEAIRAALAAPSGALVKP